VLESASHVYDIREHETIPRPFTLHCRHKAAVAGVAVVLVALAVVGPTQLVTQQLVRQVATGVNWFQSEGAAEHWRSALARHPRLAFGLAWIAEQTDLRGAIGRASSALTAGASTVVAGSVGAVAQLLVTFFALFYFFRDQRPALMALRFLVPLSEPESEAVFARVTDTIYATVFGTLAVALVQGLLGVVMFWALGLPAALLWGAVMAVLAVVPVLGAFVVWVPAAFFMALTGSGGKALILVGWGGFVVSLIDNPLYPILVGRRLRLHTLPVFIAIVGGLAQFGSAGVVLGPVTLAVAVALVEVWRRRTAGGRSAETGVNRPEDPGVLALGRARLAPSAAGTGRAQAAVPPSRAQSATVASFAAREGCTRCDSQGGGWRDGG